MPDPNLTIPEGSTPNWLLRYSDRRARTYERRAARYEGMFPRLRSRRARRVLVLLLALALALAVGSSIYAFWQMSYASIPFVIGVLGSLLFLSLLRVSNGAVADAPAQALDEIQLAQRNAVRSLAYVLLLPIVVAVYFVAITLGMREQVAGDTVAALAWLLITSVLAVTCLPDILLSWWMPDDEE